MVTRPETEGDLEAGILLAPPQGKGEPGGKAAQNQFNERTDQHRESSGRKYKHRCVVKTSLSNRMIISTLEKKAKQHQEKG